jgi:serine/threonine protein kinase
MEHEKRIEKYQFNFKQLLGQGSYASVYKGKIIETGEEVAVKVIDKRLFVNSYNLKNIQSEIDIMKKVFDNNIVKLHDVYQTSNNMYIIT